MSTPFVLPSNPRERDYEEYIASYLQAGGLYVERNAIYREEEELLELDIITSDLSENRVEKRLMEIKSGHWSFGEIFKVKGWMFYLGFDEGAFIVQESRPSLHYYRDKARLLNVDLVDNSDLSRTKDTLSKYLVFEPDDDVVEVIRAAFCLERKQLEKLKRWKKLTPVSTGTVALDDYHYRTNSKSLFFSPDPIARINSLFRAYLANRNITAKISNEAGGGDFSVDVDRMNEKDFTDTFYKAVDNIYQISLMIEHNARLTILKSCIEHIILNPDFATDPDNFLQVLFLPGNIQSGLYQIRNDPYFHLYPMFWQLFTYVFGGFILLDFEQEEYELLSSKTGIPLSQIPNAFDSFNKLFPKSDGWFYEQTNSRIKSHRLFPVPFHGIGANYRRFIWADDRKFSTLSGKLTGYMTYRDLVKWNNLAYKILSS
jgi:hypothetical protein